MRLRLVLVLALVLGAPAGAGRTASPPVDTTALLQHFEPVLYFHPQEDWAPERADSFVGRALVERQIAKGTWAPVKPPLPTTTAGCSFTPCFRFNLPCALHGGDGCYEARRATSNDWAHPVIYGRVLNVPAGTAPPPGITIRARYLIRYWLFYDFDDWRSPRERLWQAHEGDWESISIGLDVDFAPLFAAYSEHCSGTIRAWSSVTKRGGTHPVDYVALGSHANYFTNATTSTRFSECLRKYLARPELAKANRIIGLAQERVVDRTGTAHLSGPDGLAGVTPLELNELTAPLPVWARFPGRWSEGQLLWLGRIPRRFTNVAEGLGPATPNWNGTSIPSFWHAASS